VYSALAVLQVAGRESAGELDRLIAEMSRRRLLDVEQIERAIERREGARGVHRLRAALARYRPPSDLGGDASMFERDFAAWLAGLPELPRPARHRLPLRARSGGNRDGLVAMLHDG
jgi:hypothetical protein